MLSNVRLVLVSPGGAANVGSVCRAMKNMGLTKLMIVAPECDLRSADAINYSTHARDILESAIVVDNLPAALNGCVRSFATTSKSGLYRQSVAIPAAQAAKDALSLASAGDVAFIFGREDFGLRTDELLLIDQVVTIPANPAYPVLNLAAAALIICYELFNESQRIIAAPEPPPLRGWQLAANERREAMYTKLFDALERIGYLWGQNPDHLKYALRHLFGRIDLSVNEVDVLFGIARQMNWYVENHPRKPCPGDSAADPNRA